MKTSRRKPSAVLTRILEGFDEDKLRRTRNRMLVAVAIADALKAKGISQKQFAAMTGRSESEISEWLSGDRNFTIDTLSDINKYLGIELLSVSGMRTAPVSQEPSRLKFTKKKSLVVYGKREVLTSKMSSEWLSAFPLEQTVAL